MAAYPMGSLTWGEMRELLLKDHQVVEQRIIVPLKGGPEEMVFLKRQDGAKWHCHPFPILFTLDEMLTPQAIRNICGGLKLSPKPFGLPLG